MSAGFFVWKEERSEGPFTLHQMRNMWDAGAIHSATQICQEGDRQWQPAAEYLAFLEVPKGQAVAPHGRKLFVYVLLGFFLGTFGVHNFYAGLRKQARLQLVIGLILYAFSIPLQVVTGDVEWGLLLVIPAIWSIRDICRVRVDGDGRPMSW